MWCYIVTGGQLAGTPNTAANSGLSGASTNLTIAQASARWIAAIGRSGTAGSSGSSSYGGSYTLTTDGATTDSAASWGYNTQRDSGSALAVSTVVPFTVSGTPAAIAVLEIEPTTAGVQPVIDGATAGPAVTSGNFSQSSASTGAFAPTSGSLLVVAVTAPAGTVGLSVTQMSVYDSYGLEWTETVSTNSAGTGYAGIWTATVPAGLAVDTTPFPAGVAGAPYAIQVNGTGGQPPYTYGLSTVPSGFTFNTTTGILSGVPAAAGTLSLPLSVTDQRGITATHTLSATVNNDPGTGFRAGGQWHGGQPGYTYGTSPIGVAIPEHEWIVVGVSWKATQDPAISFVSDDAHNLYQLASSVTGVTTCTQLFIVPNAAATTRVYVSTSAYVRNISVSVVSFRGLGPGYQVLTTFNASGAGTSNWTATSGASVPAGSILLTAAASAAAITNTSGGSWTRSRFSAPGAYGDPGRVSSVIGWGTQASTGTASATFAMTDPGKVSKPYSSAGVVLSATASPVYSAAGYPTNPAFSVNMGFGYSPGSPSQNIPWTALPSWRFLAITGDRGRQFELDELSAAEIDLTLDNSDGAFTFGNTGSPYPNVTLVLPVQIVATWQGRNYCLFQGIVTNFEEGWEFERSVMKLTLSDDYSKLPQVLLESAVIAEQLYDDPVHLWPLNDAQGAGFASNWSGRGVSVLVPVNSKYGAGSTNGNPVTGFGSQDGSGVWPGGLEGTTDTVWANNSGIGTATQLGTCLVDRNDPTLPTHNSGGATYEVWARVNNNASNATTGAVIFLLAEEKGRHTAEYLRLCVVNDGSVGSPTTVFYLTHGNRSIVSAHAYKKSTLNAYDGLWHHYAITVSSGKVVRLYIDGTFIGSHAGNFVTASPNRLSFGADVTINPAKLPGTIAKLIGAGHATPWGFAGFFTGFLANAAVYDRVLDPERIAAHWNSGRTGFRYELSGNRIQHILALSKWSGPQAVDPGVSVQQQLNYLGGGYGSSFLSGAIGQSGTQGGAAAVDNGAQADVTVQDIASSECGLLLVQADGTLAFRQRNYQYNRAPRWYVGDQDNPLNSTSSFGQGIGPWASFASGGTVSPNSGWSYSGGPSALLTVSGTPSQAYAGSEVVTLSSSSKVGCGIWVMSPQGCTAYAWANPTGTPGAPGGNTSLNILVQPNTPTFISVQQSATAATQWQFGIAIVSPASGTTLYFDQPRLSLGGPQVSYLPGLKVSTGIEYLFNDIAITRNADQATYRARSTTSRAKYYPRVYTRTIFTDTSDPEALVDAANWLLSGYSSPQQRVSQLIIDAKSNPRYWPFVLGSDVGDVVSFFRTPVQGAPVTGLFSILQINPDIDPDVAQFTYTLAPITSLGSITIAPPFGTRLPVLVFDNPVSTLDSPAQLGW